LNQTDEIVKMINKMSGKYSAYEIFTDWVTCCAISIDNGCKIFHDDIWKSRENQYLEIRRKYTEEEWHQIVRMFSLLAESLESETKDILGDVFMKLEMGSSWTGQFFTPWNISRLNAEIGLGEPDKNGKYTINEPSCGAGAMIIAAAASPQEKGINFQTHMDVVAQDIDWKGVCMCYTQLSLLGISAVVVQGDTLMNPYIPGEGDNGHIFTTPKKRGLLL
jgi:type I restriction-modification system DNA methylase subunit